MKTIVSKSFTIFLLASILFSGMFSLVTQPAYANSCQAFITTTPSDADVFVDGRLIGKSPILHFVGVPFEADIRVEAEGFETWTQHIVVEFDEHKQVNAVLTPLQINLQDQVTVTKTVTTTITSISPTTITSTTTVAQKTVTITTEITSNITEQTGLPTELTYGAIGIAVIAIIAAIVLFTKKK